MSTTDLRRKIKQQVDVLPTDRLRSAADFIEYLGQVAAQPANHAGRKIARMRRAVRAAKAAEAAGALIPWEKLRRKS